MDLKEIRFVSVDWVNLLKDPAAGSCEHGNESSGFINGGQFLD
jgi:hypothetical protein